MVWREVGRGRERSYDDGEVRRQRREGVGEGGALRKEGDKKRVAEERQGGRNGGERGEARERMREREVGGRVGGREDGGKSQEYIKMDALYGRPPTLFTSKYRRVRLL